MIKRITKPGAFCALLLSASVFASCVPEIAKRADPDVVNCKDAPYNATGDGVADDTAALQACFTASARKTAFIPNGTYLVSVDGSRFGLQPPSNTTIVLDPNAIVRAANVAFADHGIFDLFSKTNIKFIGGQLDGNKTVNVNRRIMGIRISNSTYVEISGMQIYNMPGENSTGLNGGDGVYIGATSDTGTHDIKIQQCRIEGNVRQGISVVRASRVQILNNVIKRTTGTNPGGGVDIEPNAAGNVVRDVLIQGNHFEANHAGVIGAFPSSGTAGQIQAVKVVDNAFLNHRGHTIVLKGNGHIIRGNTVRNTTNPTVSASYHIVVSQNRGVIVTENRLQGLIGAAREGGLMRVANTNNDIVIEKNIFESTNGRPLYINGTLAPMANIIVKHNTFYNSTIPSASGGVIQIDKSSTHTITDLIITDNSIRDDRGGTAGAYGITASGNTAAEAQTWRIFNNIITGMATAKHNGFPTGYAPAE